MKSFSKVSQLEGYSQQPDELVAVAQAAAEGTSMEKPLEAERQQKRLLKRTRQGENKVEVGRGESVDQRRVDALTQANVEHNIDDWKAFLLEHKFGEVKVHAETGEEGIYVPAAKRHVVLAEALRP